MAQFRESQILQARERLKTSTNMKILRDVASSMDIDPQNLPDARDEALEWLLVDCNVRGKLRALLNAILEANPGAQGAVDEIIAMLDGSESGAVTAPELAPDGDDGGVGSLSTNQAHNLKGFAILIGCSKYQTNLRGEGKLADIPQVASNVAALREYLLLHGLHDIDFTDANVEVVPEPITADRIDQALDRLDAVNPDVLLFYYGGHGFRIGGESYLSLSTTPPNSTKARAYPESVILDRFVGKNAKSVAGRIRHKIFIYDCCRSGGDHPRAMDGDAEKPIDEPPFKSEDFRARTITGAAYLYACGPGGKAGVIGSRDYTVLVEEFLAVLNKGSSELLKPLSVRSVLEATKERVRAKRKQLAARDIYLDDPETHYIPKTGSELAILAYTQTPKKSSELAIYQMIGQLIEAKGGEFVVNAKGQLTLTAMVSDIITSQSEPKFRLALDAASLDRIFDDASLGVTLIRLIVPKTRKFDLSKDLVPLYANKRSYQIHLGRVPEPRDPKLLLEAAYLNWLVDGEAFGKDQLRVVTKLAAGGMAEPIKMMKFRAKLRPGMDQVKNLHVDPDMHGRRFYSLTLSYTLIQETDDEQSWLLLVGLLGAGRIETFKKQ